MVSSALPPHPSELAKIIPFRTPSGDGGPDHGIEVLARRVGEGWHQLPSDAGRAGLRVERLLGQAPARIDPAAPLSVGIAQAHRLVAGARAVVDRLDEEVAVLSEVLDADLGGLPFDQLDSVASAILNLAAAPAAVPAWGRSAAAESTGVVLDLVGPVLRDARAANESVYQRFTDHVWEVPADLLAAGRRRWRLVARRRLRRQLRAASRSGSLSGALTDTAQEIIDARVGRARLVPMRTLVAHHLGDLDRGVLTDVDAAAIALEAVRRLQRALPHPHDEARLERLLQADAFRSQEVLMPAWSIRTSLAAWVSHVVVAGGRDALSVDGDTLARWADHVERDLPSISAVLQGPAAAGAAHLTLRDAVDALVLREHVGDVASPREAPSAAGPVSETARAPAGDDSRWSAS